MTTPRARLRDAAALLIACEAAWPAAVRNLAALRPSPYPSRDDTGGGKGGVSDPTPSTALAGLHWQHLADQLDVTARTITDAVARLDTLMRQIPSPSVDLTAEKKRARCVGWGERHAVCDELAVYRADGLCSRCYQARYYAEVTKAKREQAGTSPDRALSAPESHEPGRSAP